MNDDVEMLGVELELEVDVFEEDDEPQPAATIVATTTRAVPLSKRGFIYHPPHSLSRPLLHARHKLSIVFNGKTTILGGIARASAKSSAELVPAAVSDSLTATEQEAQQLPIVEAHITGTVWKIEVKIGDPVSEGTVVAILESMKMELPVQSPVTGVVVEVPLAEGDPIRAGDLIVTIE